jgi:hypothetical protein
VRGAISWPEGISTVCETFLSVQTCYRHYGGAMRRERSRIRNAGVIAGLAITIVLAPQVLRARAGVAGINL